MKKLLFAVLFLFSTIMTFSQWTSNYFGGQTGDLNFTNARGNAVTSDAYGNCYVTGYTYDEVTKNDIVTIKYKVNGDTAWVKSYQGDDNQNDEGKGIFVDNTGNVYVVGFAEYSTKSTDIVLLKYSSNGTLQWTNRYISAFSASDDKGLAIAADNEGYIYITGYTTKNGIQMIMTRKCDPFGNEKWTKVEENASNYDAQGLAIAVNTLGSVYVTGYITESFNNSDIVVIKYDGNNGTQLWLQKYFGNGNTGEDRAWGIVVDQSDNAFITGYTTNSDGNTDLYTAKISSAGDILWSTTGGSGNQNDKAWGIVVDTDGSVYITGETDNSGNINYITEKYSNSGETDWTVQYDATGGTDIAASIGILVNNDNTKSIIVTGKSWGSSQNFDYATVRYNSLTGTLNQVNTYSFTGNSNDLAKDLVISPLKKVIITGFSQLIFDNSVGSSYISTTSLDRWGESLELTAVTTNTNPSRFSLYQNYPNPFNPSTTIKFDLAASSDVKLTVYDVLGKVAAVLVKQHLEAGTYNISYSNLSLSSGIYFYELTAGSYREVKKMNLVK